jgi:hypothetical protein
MVKSHHTNTQMDSLQHMNMIICLQLYYNSTKEVSLILPSNYKCIYVNFAMCNSTSILIKVWISTKLNGYEFNSEETWPKVTVPDRTRTHCVIKQFHLKGTLRSCKRFCLRLKMVSSTLIHLFSKVRSTQQSRN